MAALDFPSGPSAGDVYSKDGVYYKYDGIKWIALTSLNVGLVTDATIDGDGSTADPLSVVCHDTAMSAVQPEDLGVVAFTNDYNDLDNLPALATVATTGDYNDLINKPASGAVPVGSVIYNVGETTPVGYLVCDGAEVSRTTYSALYALLGDAYGAGDGSTTFRVPDFRGEFLRCWDAGRGIDSGRTLGTTQSGMNLAHTHDITDPGHDHSEGQTNSIDYGIDGGRYNPYSKVQVGDPAQHNPRTWSYNLGIDYTGITLDSSGGSEARPRNVALNVFIKY